MDALAGMCHFALGTWKSPAGRAFTPSVSDRRARAILVDDNDDMRFLVRMILEREPGIDVVAEVADGVAALEAWRAGKGDVIVTDQKMPGMTGVEIAEVVLAQEPHTPVILYSAYLDELVIAAAERAGVCKVIEKDHYKEIPSAIWECIDTHV